MCDLLRHPGGSSERPTFETVYITGLPFVRQVLRFLGVAARDLEDVLQDVMLAAYRGLDRFDPEYSARNDGPSMEAEPRPGAGRRPALHTALRRWLFGIAWRQVSHYRERAYRRREIACGAGASWPFQTIDPSPSAEQIVADEQRSKIVGRLLVDIEIERRAVLIMFDLLDLSVADIADELRISEVAVRNRLRLAREEFRIAVKRMNAEERAALRASGVLGVSEPGQRPDPHDVLRSARVFPDVPEALRRRLWSNLQKAIASDEASRPQHARVVLGDGRPAEA